MTHDSITGRPSCRWGLYLISDDRTIAEGTFLPFLQGALEAGVRVIQLRSKNLDDREFLTLGHAVRDLTRQTGACFIVNDRVHLASELKADGVHVGQGDADPTGVREQLGPDALIGWSTHNRAQIERAAALPIDYIGVGPMYATTTKADADPVTGPGLLAWAQDHCPLPTVAIGGIALNNLAPILETGTANTAVISAISQADDPLEETRRFLRAIAQSAGSGKSGRSV